MGQIEHEFNGKWRVSPNEFDTRVADLYDKKFSLMRTNKQLDGDLNVVLGKTCPECIRKRSQIRPIMEKRDPLHEEGCFAGREAGHRGEDERNTPSGKCCIPGDLRLVNARPARDSDSISTPCLLSSNLLCQNFS
jgi:hypothetical protein